MLDNRLPKSVTYWKRQNSFEISVLKPLVFLFNLRNEKCIVRVICRVVRYLFSATRTLWYGCFISASCGLTIVVAFLGGPWSFGPKFWEVAGAYEWYFAILWMQVDWGVTQTLPAVIEFVWTFLHSEMVGMQKHFPCVRSCSATVTF